MAEKILPFSEDKLKSIAEEYGTPLHIYDASGIEKTTRALSEAFSWVEGPNGEKHKNYFAIKATPNPHLMSLLRELGMGFDASSNPELALAKAVGAGDDDVIFTSNNTPVEEYKRAYKLGAVINLDDINQIDVLEEALDGEFPEVISIRYNPGPDIVTGEENTIGTPEEAKFGVPASQLADAYRRAQELGAKRFGIHTMVVSNELDAQAHIKTAEIMFDKIVELSSELGISFEFLNLAGGFGVDYRPEDQPVDLTEVSEGIRASYQERIINNGLPKLRIITEYGRYVTGPHGYLLTKVRSIKEGYHRIVGVDASMADLARPAMYDSYHHIYVVESNNREVLTQRVVGGICENNDYFTGKDTKDRELPKMDTGDLLVVFDAGAHGHAMGGNYNSKTRSAEVLVNNDGNTKLIRRAETESDLFATLDYEGLK